MEYVPTSPPWQDKLGRITSRYLAAAAAAQQRGQGQAGSGGGGSASQPLEAYVLECAELLGLRSRRQQQGSDGSQGQVQGQGDRAAEARAALAEVLEAVVACKMPDAAF